MNQITKATTTIKGKNPAKLKDNTFIIDMPSYASKKAFTNSLSLSCALNIYLKIDGKQHQTNNKNITDQINDDDNNDRKKNSSSNNRKIIHFI